MMHYMLGFVTGLGLAGGVVLALNATHNAPPFVQVAQISDEDRAQLAPRRLIIGLDISKSNPLIDKPDFAAKVGAKIGDMVRQMGFASEVHVRTFGSYDAAQNNFAFDTVLSVRSRPENVGAEVEKLVAGVPVLVERGKFHPQNYTNILGFLDNMRESVGCDGMPTTIVLASDGIEDSEYARLDKDSAHLPLPAEKQFGRCESLQIFGIGQGTRSPKKTARLRDEWERWAHAAGFHSFVALNDW
jgi:hypothetical protein